MPFGRGGAGGHFALGDPLGPVGVDLERPLFALVVQHAVHRSAANARAEPPLPRLCMCLELGLGLQHVIDGTRELIPELMAEVAVGLERVDVVVLREHGFSKTVALGAGPGAGKLLCRRRLEERQPVVAGIDLRRLLRGLGRSGGEREFSRTGLGLNRRRVHQAVSPDEDAVIGCRQFGHHESALIVGDDDLDEVGRQVLGLCDDPDPRLRALAAAHHAGEIALRRGPLRLQSAAGIEGRSGNQANQAHTNEHTSKD
jgi:hypothetical protein